MRRSRLVFSRRFSSEKSPTITVASFFRQTTDLIVYVPLFTETAKTTQAKSGQCKLSAKGPPFIFSLFYVTYKTGRDQRVPLLIFFGAANFFRKFLCLKRVPLRVFDILQQCMLMNPKGSPLFIFQHCATFFERKKYEVFFSIFLFPVGESDFPVISSMKGTLGISKLLSKLFMNTSWAYLKDFALFEP